MTKKEAIKYLQQLYPNGGHCWLDEQRIEAIDMAIKALQEVPVSERFTFKAIPRLLEMIEPTDRAKAYIAKLADILEVEGYSTDAKIVRECLKIMNGEKVPMATMDEEPVSEELEEEIVKRWKVLHGSGNPTPFDTFNGIANHFAKWQKEQMMKDAKSGIGNYDNYIKFDDGTWIDLDPSEQLKPAFNVNEGDKVKVIVVDE